jgi:uncharacterized protein YdaU (DUF1376 family)
VAVATGAGSSTAKTWSESGLRSDWELPLRMRNSLFWFPMNPQELLSRTAGLSIEARAAYVYLILHAWLAGNRGEPPASVPDNNAVLERITGLGQRWDAVRSELLHFFDVVEGRLVERELLSLWNAQLTAYSRRVAAGRKGGHSRRSKQSPSNAKALLTHPESEVEVKRSPSGGGALPSLRFTRNDAVDRPVRAADTGDRVSAWERDHPDRAAALMAKIASDLAIPVEKRATPSRWVRAQFENLVIEELRTTQGEVGNG